MTMQKEKNDLICYFLESSNPLIQTLTGFWILAFAGMTLLLNN
ncbi:MAG: hypothetical protein MAG581_02572 [Deltaproteobacteria bacterium]|nr:hypothetical protein [Deltaproteobacteria bacterium]